MSIYHALIDLFDRAIGKTLVELGVADDHSIQTLITPSKVADYQCNSVMSIMQLLKAKTPQQKVSPQDIAKKICSNLESNAYIEKHEVAGPGFINIYLAKQFALTEIKNLLLNDALPPYISPEKKYKRAIVDFSSPNIAKEMHVGHLR